MDVKKKTGKTEPFMPEKVVVSIVKAGAPYEVAKQIAQSLSAKPASSMKSSEIRDYIFKELKTKGYTSVVAHWESYDKKKPVKK